MKKLLSKPGFELIFSLTFIAILCLPPVLLAQNKIKKDVDIQIVNGDTTINGKNIKELSATDRQDALSDINNLNNAPKYGDRHKFIFKRRDTLGGDMAFNNFNRKRPAKMRDSLGMKGMGRHGWKKQMNFSYRYNDEAPERPEPAERGFNRPFRGGRPMFDRKNSQNFEYVNTDNEGVSTRVSFRVSEASDDDLKRMPYVEGPKFEIKDLNLVPQFSSGKILLMFNLLSKAPAEIKLSDSEGKLLWSEKAIGGTFNKSFALGLNGVYYLQIQQGRHISLKKIMKEE